tara:strand:+ start:54228 stop:55274 length:1047 start_codon:yes stop_codon:yes gene_type:complete
MKQTKRFLLQSLLWFVIWLVLWYFEGGDPGFLKENAAVFVAQILLLAGLMYYAAPVLLLNKKYLLFFSISLSAILISCFILSNLSIGPESFPRPLEQGQPMLDNLPDNAPRMRKPVSRVFIHFLILTIVVILGTFLETLIFAQKKEEETIKNLNEKLETELKLLKSQINPHFLFNTLNNIYALSAIDTKKTQESISYLSNMLRYVLYECEQPTVPLNKEIEYIENYIKLFTVKSSKTYPITTSFELENKHSLIAPMLLISFVENAFKHSNIEKINNAFIRIIVRSTNNEIYFEIENSKTDTVLYKDVIGGIGLENVKKRLNILYSNKHQLVIDENLNSFKVQLKLQLK